MKSERVYRQGIRAQSAAETRERILAEAERLFSSELFDRVSLDAVARAAEVSIPTLQRAFGNKEGLFAAVGAIVRARVLGQRQPPLDDVDGALAALLDHYELEGRMVWHLLRQEADVPLLQPALADARALHRGWVEDVFRASLRGLSGAPRARRIDALVAATDLYVWKLLRVDLGRSRAEVEHTMKAMARAVAHGGAR